jgi:hypothetical protein
MTDSYQERLVIDPSGEIIREIRFGVVIDKLEAEFVLFSQT